MTKQEILKLLITKELAQVYVTLLWMIFWGILLFAYRKHVERIASFLVRRIQQGAAVTMPFGLGQIGEPPRGLPDKGAGAAVVSDPKGEAELPPGFSTEHLDNKYDELLAEGYYLVHAAEVRRERTSPKSGRYRVRVWVETYNDKVSLDDIERVTYRVWGNFRRPVIATTSRKTDFDLWLSVYGEFPVLACIERKGKPPLVISRYIELPGRPPD